MPTASLHIGERVTRLVVRADGASREFTLALGLDRPGARPFASLWPTETELEAAIEAVEDIVMPLAREIARGTALHTADPQARSVADWLARPAGAVLTLDDVEASFRAMADIAVGQPPSVSRLPAEPGLCAWVLIVRELMHHLGLGTLGIAAA